MNGQNDNNTYSTRTGLRRIIPRWEYRHLRVIANLRIGISGLLAIFGILTLAYGAYGAYGWTAFWWVLAAAHGSLGFWELTIARSTAPRT